MLLKFQEDFEVLMQLDLHVQHLTLKYYICHHTMCNIQIYCMCYNLHAFAMAAINFSHAGVQLLIEAGQLLFEGDFGPTQINSTSVLSLL